MLRRRAFIDFVFLTVVHWWSAFDITITVAPAFLTSLDDARAEQQIRDAANALAPLFRSHLRAGSGVRRFGVDGVASIVASPRETSGGQVLEDIEDPYSDGRGMEIKLCKVLSQKSGPGRQLTNDGSVLVVHHDLTQSNLGLG